MERRITKQILSDLNKKMVFLSGPRQCGKTTFAKELFDIKPGIYYNWDNKIHQKFILKNQLDFDQHFWIFDEIHKYRKWRNFLKGFFDTYKDEISILATGSARLEFYGKGGDSLQGRYFPHHLHPFTLSEVAGVPFYGIENICHFGSQPTTSTKETLEDLLQLGGFPEPFLSGSEMEAKRWRLSYGERLIQEEIRSLEKVQDLASMELLSEQLESVAGSVISVNSLREDLSVAFGTVNNWLHILERLFVCFRLQPFGPAKIKAVKKEQKLYLWDWARIKKNEGARFENMIALHLIRLVDWARDIEGEKLELRYFKMRTGEEVDFVLLKDKKPWVAIEVKLQEQPLAKSLVYLLERTHIPHAFQVFLHGNKEHNFGKINGTIVRSISAERFLLNLA